MRHCIVERSRGRKSRGTHITKSTGGQKVVKREMPGLESAKSIEWSLEIEKVIVLEVRFKRMRMCSNGGPQTGIWSLDVIIVDV